MSRINTEFTQDQLDYLSGLYLGQNLPVDQLPYTLQFQQIVGSFHARYRQGTSHQIWTTLVKLRKRQLLPHKSKAGKPEPALFS
jgi:hypothetical protein